MDVHNQSDNTFGIYNASNNASATGPGQSGSMRPVPQAPNPNAPEYKLFYTSTQSLEGLKELLRSAKTSIDFETFFILPDSLGRQIMDILLERARAGVHIRLLADAMGSFSLSQSLYIKEFHKAGSHIKFFNSFLPFAKNKKAIWYLRNHRRTIIVDGKALFVGSLCLGELTKEWIETCIELRKTDAVAQAQVVFNRTWKKIHHKTFRIGNSSVLSTDPFSYITQSPLQRQRNLYSLLIKKIRESKKEITLIAPYVIPDHRLMRTLSKAVKRGVRVRIICPKRTDFRPSDIARDGYINYILRKNIEIYLLPIMVHSKVAIFDPLGSKGRDGNILPPTSGSAFVGTLNLDNISLRYNYECSVYTDDRNCVHELSEHFNDLIMGYPNSRIEADQWEKRGFWAKFLEAIIWPFRKLL